MEFEKRLDAAKAEVGNVQLPAPPAPPAVPAAEVPGLPQPITAAGVIDLPAMVEAVDQIAETAPQAAIAEAWRYVEIAIQRALKRRQLSRPRFPRELRKLLEEEGLLDARLGAVLDDLRGMRNQAIHAGEMRLTHGQAVDYALVVAIVIAALDPEALPLRQ